MGRDLDETEYRFASWKYFDLTDRAGGAHYGDFHGADRLQPDGHGLDRHGGQRCRGGRGSGGHVYLAVKRCGGHGEDGRPGPGGSVLRRGEDGRGGGVRQGSGPAGHCHGAGLRRARQRVRLAAGGILPSEHGFHCGECGDLSADRLRYAAILPSGADHDRPVHSRGQQPDPVSGQRRGPGAEHGAGPHADPGLRAVSAAGRGRRGHRHGDGAGCGVGGASDLRPQGLHPLEAASDLEAHVPQTLPEYCAHRLSHCHSGYDLLQHLHVPHPVCDQLGRRGGGGSAGGRSDRGHLLDDGRGLWHGDQRVYRTKLRRGEFKAGEKGLHHGRGSDVRVGNIYLPAADLRRDAHFQHLYPRAGGDPGRGQLPADSWRLRDVHVHRADDRGRDVRSGEDHGGLRDHHHPHRAADPHGHDPGQHGPGAGRSVVGADNLQHPQGDRVLYILSADYA